MLPSPCYVISDAHLGVADRDAERLLIAFLRDIRRDARSLVINGDLFDFWFEWKHVIPRAGYRVLAALADLADAGVQVTWIAGNHDCWGGDVLRKDVGVAYVVGTWRGEIDGWATRIDHGDGLRDAEDRKYRALRSVLRNGLAIHAFRWLHPDLASRLALGSSHASRTYRAKDGGAGLHAVAMRDLAADPTLQLLIFGHSHVPDVERAPGGGVYANAGTWLGDSTFLRIGDDGVELRRFRITQSGPGSDLLRREPRRESGRPAPDGPAT
ncbi:MAG: UDP-2,3-diacylglucosamine diphosphatase [Gemmatimonadaceae bacterium]